MAHDLLLTTAVQFDEAQYTRAAQGAAVKINRTLAGGGNQQLTFKGVDFALGRITGKANEFQKSLEASNARVIAFGASAGAIFALRAAFDKLVSSTIDVEKSLTDINALLGLGAEDLQRFSNNLFKVANQTGQSFSDAAKAATEFSRQGLGVEETLKRTAAALTLNRLSGLGFEESVSSLTGVLNSFTKEALDAEDVINRLTAVDARYAVSSADLAKALSRVGASANDANVSLNETIALVTAAQQVTARGGSVIGNAFKTIFTRLQRPQVLDDLEAAGIAVRNLDGKTRPVIEVLRSLAQTYDNLSGAQKSFVAETVGGVYQINVLKAVMSDLGNGTSIVQGALQTAADSAGSAEARLKILNGTISSSLVRTMNDLTQASYNVGTALLSITARSGLTKIQETLQKIAYYSDPNRLIDGNKFTQTFATLFQGLLKGVGNLLGGPGLQLGVTILLKLLERLQKFIIDSTKDLTGIDSEAKKRVAIEKDVVTYLTKQKDQYQGLLDGQISLNELTQNYLNDLRLSNAELKTMSIFAKSITNNVAPSLSISPVPKTTAGGHYPDPEQVAAKREQYSPGRTISTVVRHGSTSIPVLANTRETRSTVIGKDGKPYDFINPPEGTSAWMRHRQRSMAATGIDPKNLRRTALAGGLVAMMGMPKAQGEIPKMPQSQFLEEVKNFFGIRYAQNPSLVDKMLNSTRKSISTGSLSKYAGGIPLIGNTGNSAFRQVIGGLFQKRDFPELTTEDKDAFAGHLTKTNILGTRAETYAAEKTVLNPEDVQKVLTRHAKDFPLIAAYENANDVTTPKARDTSIKVKVLGQEYDVPVRILGDNRGVSIIENVRKRLASLPEDLGEDFSLQVPSRKSGAAFGIVYDEFLSNFFAKRGVPVSDTTVEGVNDENNPNATLDILGYHQDIAKFTGSSQRFAGADAKASVGEGLHSVAKKIFKVLAGDPYKEELKGPVTQVPPLTNVGRFDTTNRNVGILDSDAVGQGRDFHALVYAAIATGKPLKVIYGPPGAGKTTKAKQYGGEAVTQRDDLSYYDQFILTSAAASEKNYKQGAIGLAFSSAADIEALSAHPDELRKRLGNRDLLHDPNVKINETSLKKYADAFEYLSKTYSGLGRYSFTTSASGYLPAIRTALSRENKATDGRAVLSSHPKLVSVRNPLGIAAIDRKQGTVENAIREHLKYQTMEQVKGAKTGAGGVSPEVPNLATTENFGNSIGLAVAGWATQVIGAGDKINKFALKFPGLVSNVDLEIAKQKSLLDSYDKLRQELLTGAIAQGRFNKELFVGRADVERLEDTYKVRLAAIAASLGSAQQKLNEQRNSTSGLGIRAAIAGSIGGGILSSIATSLGGKIGPSLGAGLEDFSTGISNAGQALIAFPNRIGKVIGASLLGGGFVSAVDTLIKGIENSRRTFEIQQSASQKLLSQVDALTATLSNFDSLLGDTAVTQDTINRETRKYFELLAQLKQIPNGGGIATKIETAPDNRSRIAALAEFKQFESIRQDSLATQQLVKELAAKRSGLGISSGTFSYSNPLDKESAQQNLIAIASSALTGVSDEFKAKLSDSVESLDAFNAVIKDNDNSLTQLLEAVSKTGKPEDRALLTQEIRSLLASQKLNANPQLRAARADLISGNEQRQQKLDDAIRRQEATRRTFVNQGALQSGNTLDIRALSNAAAFGAAQVRQAQAQAQSGLFQLQFGERTNRAFSFSTELSRIESERQNKRENVGIQSSRNLVDALTQSFDSTLKNAEGLKEIGNNQSQIGIGEFKLNLIEGLNKGIATVINQGNIGRFQEGGKFNFDKLEESIARNSGAAPALQRQIQAYLSNNRSIDLLKNIQTANLEMANIDQESLVEAQKQTAAFEGFKAEINFRELSSFLGGIRNLLDRNARRGNEREAIRSAFLLERGTTPEARGIGGAGLLKFFKDQNIPIELDKNTDLSKLMKRAFQAAATGLADVNTGSLGRILGAVGRGAGTTAAGLQSYGNVNLRQSAVAALQAEFKPENAKVLGDSLQQSSDNMLSFNAGLRQSVAAIQNFAASIIATKSDLDKAIGNVGNVRKQNAEEAKGPQANYEALAKAVGESVKDAIQAAQPRQRTNIGGNIVNIAEGALGAVLGGAAIARYFRGGRAVTNPLSRGFEATSQPFNPREFLATPIPALTPTSYRQEYLNKKNEAAVKSSKSARDEAALIAANNAQFANIPFRVRAPQQGYYTTNTQIQTPRFEGRIRNPAQRLGYYETTTVLQPPKVNFGINPNKNAEREAAKAYYRAQAAERAANPTGFPVGQVNVLPTPAQSGAAAFRGVAGRGVVGALGIAGQVAAAQIQNPLLSLGASYGVAAAPSVLGRLGIGGLLKGGAFGIGSGASLTSAGLGGVLGSGALIGASAYGGFKTGQYLNQFTRAGKLDSALGDQERDFVDKVQAQISKAISKGKSNEEIQRIIDTAIHTTEGQLSDSRSGFITKIFGTTATGSGKSESSLTETIAALKDLKNVAAQAKEQQAAGQRQEQLQENLIKVLDKLANGGGQNTEGAQINSAIKVEISLKDADKIPEVLALKLIEPLKKQFADLQTQVGAIAEHVNISPSPAKI